MGPRLMSTRSWRSRRWCQRLTPTFWTKCTLYSTTCRRQTWNRRSAICSPPCLTTTRPGSVRYAVYLLYWYKSANTDAAGAVSILCSSARRRSRTISLSMRSLWTGWTRRYSVYLLYSYKSTNTDTPEERQMRASL